MNGWMACRERKTLAAPSAAPGTSWISAGWLLSSVPAASWLAPEWHMTSSKTPHGSSWPVQWRTCDSHNTSVASISEALRPLWPTRPRLGFCSFWCNVSLTQDSPKPQKYSRGSASREFTVGVFTQIAQTEKLVSATHCATGVLVLFFSAFRT